MEWLTEEPDPVDDLLARAHDELIRQTAAGYLTGCGLRLLATGWQCSEGAIDVLAAEGRVLVVCDICVRPRRGLGLRRPMTRARVRQLRRLAVRWLTTNGVLFHEVRIDVIELTKQPAGGFIIEHVRGVA